MRSLLTILWSACCEAQTVEEATIYWNGLCAVLAQMATEMVQREEVPA